MRYACTVAELGAPGSRRAVTLGAREIVLVRTDEGVHAIDRACPHEGYGLEEGTVEGATLTCVWHGWRFDLRSGSCLVAGEDVRTYAVAIRDGAIFVDVDVEATEPELELASEALVAALETGRPTLAARRCARLLDLGAGVDHVARLLVRYGATHADAGLDPETAAVADALAAAARLPPGQSRYLFADVAAALAERLARAAPRFGPEPASSFAWADDGVRDTLAELVADGDDEEAEAVVAGMVAAGVPASEIGAGLALGLARSYRGPWPLIVLERAVRLADLLGEDAARVVLPVAAHGCACAPEAGGREPFRSAVDAVAGNDADPARVIAACSRAMPANDRDGTLLLCGLALAYADAARWAVDRAGTAARPLVLHAEALLHALGGRRGAEAAAVPEADLAVDLASSPASTSRGLAICLAAAVAAWRTPDSAVTSGVHRLLVLPKRERFTDRHVDGEGLELP